MIEPTMQRISFNFLVEVFAKKWILTHMYMYARCKRKNPNAHTSCKTK